MMMRCHLPILNLEYVGRRYPMTLFLIAGSGAAKAVALVVDVTDGLVHVRPPRGSVPAIVDFWPGTASPHRRPDVTALAGPRSTDTGRATRKVVTATRSCPWGTGQMHRRWSAEGNRPTRLRRRVPGRRDRGGRIGIAPPGGLGCRRSQSRTWVSSRNVVTLHPRTSPVCRHRAARVQRRRPRRHLHTKLGPNRLTNPPAQPLRELGPSITAPEPAFCRPEP